MMKILTYVLTALVFTGFFIIQSSFADKSQQSSTSFYTTEVKKVTDNKCYGCHSVNGKSQDAKDALMWDDLPGLQKSKQVATLNDIIKVLERKTMPPASAVKKYPEMKLSPDESKILQSWAESKAESLLK